MSQAAAWNERYAGPDPVWSGEPNQFVVEACTGLAPGRALDLGAGEGRNALWLATQGWTVTAVDFAEHAVSRITAHAALDGLPVTAEVADVVQYRPTPATYDLVLFSYLQLPLAQLRKAITNAATGLRAGGRMVLVAHDASNLISGFGGPRDPNQLTTTAQVSDAMTEAGLTVERATVLERRVLVDNTFRDALDHVVVALA